MALAIHTTLFFIATGRYPGLLARGLWERTGADAVLEGGCCRVFWRSDPDRSESLGPHDMGNFKGPLLQGLSHTRCALHFYCTHTCHWCSKASFQHTAAHVPAGQRRGHEHGRRTGHRPLGLRSLVSIAPQCRLCLFAVTLAEGGRGRPGQSASTCRALGMGPSLSQGPGGLKGPLHGNSLCRRWETWDSVVWWEWGWGEEAPVWAWGSERLPGGAGGTWAPEKEQIFFLIFNFRPWVSLGFRSTNEGWVKYLE